MDEAEKEIIEYLLLNGALEAAGISETGEPLYNFTPKLKYVLPELYEEHMKHVNSELMRLWEKGFIDMDLFADSPVVKLAPKAFNNDELAKLSDQDQFAVKEIKRILMHK